jgi:hypothetical protein
MIIIGSKQHRHCAKLQLDNNSILNWALNWVSQNIRYHIFCHILLKAFIPETDSTIIETFKIVEVNNGSTQQTYFNK